MGLKWEKAGLVLWSLISSPCVLDPEKTRSLFLLWEDIWRKERVAPWIAKVPISSVGVRGEYADIHGIGGVEGWFETHSGYIPGCPLLPVYQVVDDISITVEPPARLTYRTKKRLEAWLKRAYPQRFRPPEALPGVHLSWAELFSSGSKLEDFKNLRRTLVEAQLSRAKARFGELSETEVNAIRAATEVQFSDTLKTYRRRRYRALSQALESGPRFTGLMHPTPEYYLCAGRLTAFRRCVIFWNEKGEQKIVRPALPFAVEGTVTLP